MFKPHKRNQFDRDIVSHHETAVLVTPRDPKLWNKDNTVKKAKSNTDNSQHGTNYLLEQYLKNQKWLRSNIHLTIGRQRI